MKNIFLISASMFIEIAVYSQPGSLDPTFGIGGKVTTDIGGDNDAGISLAIQNDGKLVVAGYSYNGSDYDVALVRYNADGTLDSTFGTGGKVTTPVGNDDDYGLSIGIQSDGKFVVAGYSFNGLNNDFALVRFKNDGALDSLFGTNGKVTTAVGSYGEVVYSLAIQTDGKLIAAGYSDTTTGDFFALVRYNTDGSIDTAFGAGGKIITHIGLTDDQIYSVKLQSDGKIVAGGYSYNGVNWDFALARYNTDGSPDNFFGIGGIVTTPVGTSDGQCYAVAIQNDGKIVGAGWDYLSLGEYAVARYNTDGSLDNTFGSGGIVSTSVGTISDDADAVAIQSDGDIVVAGNSSNGANDDFGIVRYNSDGNVDSTFGNAGRVVTDFGSNDLCLSVAIQSDHKIVAAGFSGVNGSRDFVLARYDAGSVGLKELPADHSFLLYPNPFTTELIIKGASAEGEIILSDISGMEIYRQKIVSRVTKINTEKLLPGIYLLSCRSDNGEKNIKAIKF